MPKYFDIHSHLNFKDYENDLEEVLGRLKESETWTIIIGTDLESSKKALELATKHDGVFACIGKHPVDKSNENFDISKYRELVSHPKVVAIGECGFDFFHAKRDDYERQKDIFVKQIELAQEFDKPLMLHIRDAYDEALEILENYPEVRGNAHFFAGSKEIAKRFVDIGFTLSFTGVITFTKDYDEVIKSVPLNMIMSETDAPFVAPAPYRGKRNEPVYVEEVVKRIAEIRGEDEEEVREELVKNALNMIGY